MIKVHLVGARYPNYRPQMVKDLKANVVFPECGKWDSHQILTQANIGGEIVTLVPFVTISEGVTPILIKRE